MRGDRMKWTLKNARNDYLKNTPKCINCKFVDNEGTLRCLVKEDYCINLGGALNCEYFTITKKQRIIKIQKMNKIFNLDC